MRLESVGDGLCLDMVGQCADHYKKVHSVGFWHHRAMRDPCVMCDPTGDGWPIYSTARVSGSEEANAGGVFGFATSPDFLKWTYERPVFEGGAYSQLEVLQVCEVNGLWNWLFCVSGGHWSEATPFAQGK